GLARGRQPTQDGLVRILAIEVYEGYRRVVVVIGVEPQDPFAEAVIAPQRLSARLRRFYQVLDDRRRDVVAVQRRIQRRSIASRLRQEQVALQDAVIERRVGVDARLEEPVELLEGGPAIALVSIR